MPNLFARLKHFFAKIIKRQYSTIHDAVENGSAMAVRVFLDEGADVNTRNVLDETLLRSAIWHGHTEVVRVLLEYDANVEDENENTLLHVIASGDLLANDHKAADIARILLEHLPNIDRTYRGYTSLHLAAKQGNVEVTQVLLEHRANIEARTGRGNTPLHAAASSGHVEIVQLLLERGANLNAQNNNGETPIVVAFEQGHLDIVHLLRQRGAVLPEHLQEEVGALGQVNGNQSVHTVSVHIGVSNSVKALQRHYHLSEEGIAKAIAELTQCVEAFPENPNEGMKDKSVAAKRGLALLKSINFVDERSGVSLREALALTWRGLNDEKERAKTPDELKEIITTWLYNTQRNYNISKKGVDNGEPDSPSCASGSFNQAVYTLQGRHRLVNIPVVEKATITLKIPALANEHFDRFTDEERRRYTDESTEDLSPALIERLRELISKDLHAEFDPFNSPGLNVNEIIEEGLKFSLPYVAIHRLQDSLGKREVGESKASASSSESPSSLSFSPPF